MMSQNKGQKIIFLALFLLISCRPQTETPTAPLSELAQAGKTSYLSNCIACHHSDPAQNGSVGPALKGTSYEVLYAKVMTRSYPKGYKAKRTTEMMPQMPHLETELKGIEAFLNQ